MDSGPDDQPFSGGAYDNDRRIGNAGQARELWTRLYTEGMLRAQSWAQIRNQIEGGRPFDPDAIARSGESWRTNVNFNDARAAFRRVSMPYWKMVNETPRKISVRVHSMAPEADKWGLAMAEVHDRFLDDWGPDYFMQFSGFADDFVMYGPGYTMFPDGKTPRWKWAPSVQIYFPKRTKANPDDWELVAMKRELTADQLVNLVRDKKEQGRSKASGWNTDAVYKAIKQAAPGPNNTRFFDPNYWQDLVVSNDLVIGGVWPPVVVVDLWAKSRDGKKIRHYIFTDQTDVSDYLYESDEEAESFREIFGPCFYNVGSNGLIHSIKGFGVMNYYYSTAINRTKCRALDSAAFAMGMNFVQEDNTPEESPPVQNYSMVNVFPKGLSQLQWYPQLGLARELMNDLQQNQNENNFIYSEVKEGIENTDTATQAKLIAAVGAEMGSATASIFLSQFGANVFSESFRRLRKKGSTDPDAVKFVKRCKELGVPDMAIHDLEVTVKCGASPMMASPAQRKQAIVELNALIYNKPGANKRWIDEMTVADILGADAVNKALLPEGSVSAPRARREAIMENADFAQGIPLPVDPSDAHVEHLDEHLKPMEATVQAAQAGQQITPDHLILFQVGLKHCAEHLQFLSQDETKRQEFQQLNARFKAVVSVADGIMKRMAKAQQMGQGADATATALQAPPQ